MSIAIIIILGLIGTIYIIAKTYSIQKRIELINTLKQRGFVISTQLEQEYQIISNQSVFKLLTKPLLKTWYLNKGGMQLKVTESTENQGQSQDQRYQIEYTTSKELGQVGLLSIRKRGIMDRLINRNKGDFHGLDPELNIHSTNVMLVKYIMSGGSQYYLQEMLKHSKEYSIGFNKLIVKRDTETLINMSDNIIRFNKLLLNFVQVKDKEHSYTQVEMIGDINLEGVELQCVICYQGGAEDLQLLNCCGSVVHKEHLTSWLQKKKICPYCQQEVFTLMSVSV